MSVDTSTRTDDLALDTLRAAGLAPAAIAALRDRADLAAAESLAPGFHGPFDIDSLDGLAGTFLWAEEPGVRTITFTFDPATPGLQGQYLITTGLLVVEQGTFTSIPNNPAVGFAFLRLEPTGGTVRILTFAGVVVDDAGRIVVALLNKIGPNGPVQPAFPAVRTS